MVGVLDDFDNRMTLDYKNEGDVIVLLGKQQNDIASSEYLHKLKAVEYSPAPHFDLEEEFQLQQFVAAIIKDKLIESAHDISEGGLAITLIEKGFNKNLGFDVTVDTTALRTDAFWFGEAQSRVVVTCSRQQAESLKQKAESSNIAFTVLGVVTSGLIKVNGENWGAITDWKDKYDTAIEQIINNP